MDRSKASLLSTPADFISITFGVRTETQPGEVVCLSGNLQELGDWRHSSALVLHSAIGKEKGGLHTWSRSLKLPTTKIIHYRYSVGIVREGEDTGEGKDVVVIRRESNPQPRLFDPREALASGTVSLRESIFGNYDSLNQADRGWLTCQTEVRLRLHNNPVRWYRRKYQEFKYRVHCEAIDLRPEDVQNNVVDHDDAGVSHDPMQATMANHTLVSSLNSTECKPTLQPKYGIHLKENTYMTFFTQNLEPEFTGFRFNFYPDKNRSKDHPETVGHAYLLPIGTKLSVGKKTVPIVGLHFKPIGQVTVEWLIIKPMPLNPCNLELTFARYWRQSRKSLDVAHRGLGSSYNAVYREFSAVRENTLASLSHAAAHGADFVEFDVQLSKDKVPVIYHDFTVCLSMRKKDTHGLDWFEIGVHELNHSQLQLFKVEHAHVKDKGVDADHVALEPDATDNQPFPSLREVYEAIDPNVGFNVEVKYPQSLKSSGELEEGLKHFMDRNEYVDCILREVLDLEAASAVVPRRLILSCFDPEVCSMMRVKQNKFPVMFLTQGATERYPHYADTRTNCTETAIYFCESEGLLGLNANTEGLLKTPEIITKAKERGFIVFCWGEDADNKDTIQRLKDLGASAVIYDRISEIKENKENIFRLENQAREHMLQRAPENAKSNDSLITLMDTIGFHRIPHIELPPQLAGLSASSHDDGSESDPQQAGVSAEPAEGLAEGESHATAEGDVTAEDHATAEGHP